MKRKPVVLRKVHKAEKAANIATAAHKARCKLSLTCEQAVDNTRARKYPPSIPELFTAVDPLVLRVVRGYLEEPSAGDAMMLDAWERVGRLDAARNPRFEITANHLRSMTPLGIACLVRYARGFEDERQALTSSALRVAD